MLMNANDLAVFCFAFAVNKRISVTAGDFGCIPEMEHAKRR